MSSDAVRRSRPARLPGAVNLAAGLCIALLLTYFALTAHQNNPPAVAEFAPQAQKPIKDAPQEQTSAVGQGRSGAAVAAPVPSPSPLPPDAVYLHCVGDPPRQTEDPQSPPCVPYWKGNNGGSTWKGVDGGTITISVFASSQGDVWGGGAVQALNGLVHFFNTRFELYNRTIAVKTFTTSGATPQNQQADAATIDSSGAFAALPDNAYVNASGGGNQYFSDALAQRHIISVLSDPTQTITESHLSRFAPYEWTFFPPIDVAGRHLADLICQGLKSHPPKWAGQGVNTTPTRKFGIIQDVSNDGTVWPIDTLMAGLNNCGVTPFVRQYQSSDSSGTKYTAPVQAMQANGVTTVTCICLGNDVEGGGFMTSADANAYYPEWLIPGVGLQDLDDEGQLAQENAPGQANHRFGLTGVNKLLPVTQMPWWWAVSAGDPSANAQTYQASSWYYGAYFLYEGLLELLSWIQMAGPDLTPQNLQRGLQRAVFPDPGASAPPLYQGRVSFASGSHTFTQDMSGIWWSGSAQSNYFNGYTGGSGAWCHLDRGLRYTVGAWPAGQPDFFTGSCY